MKTRRKKRWFEIKKIAFCENEKKKETSAQDTETKEGKLCCIVSEVDNQNIHEH